MCFIRKIMKKAKILIFFIFFFFTKQKKMGERDNVFCGMHVHEIKAQHLGSSEEMLTCLTSH